MSVDFTQIINNFLSAELGEEVRGSLVAIARALQNAINSQLNTVTSDLTDTSANAAARAKTVGDLFAKTPYYKGVVQAGTVEAPTSLDITDNGIRAINISDENRDCFDVLPDGAIGYSYLISISNDIIPSQILICPLVGIWYRRKLTGSYSDWRGGIDNSLSIRYAAADAEATGNFIRQLMYNGWDSGALNTNWESGAIDITTGANRDSTHFIRSVKKIDVGYAKEIQINTKSHGVFCVYQYGYGGNLLGYSDYAQYGPDENVKLLTGTKYIRLTYRHRIDDTVSPEDAYGTTIIICDSLFYDTNERDNYLYPLQFDNGNLSTTYGTNSSSNIDGSLVSQFVSLRNSTKIYLSADPSLIIAAFFYGEHSSYLGYTGNLKGGSLIDVSTFSDAKFVRFTAHKSGYADISPSDAWSIIPIFNNSTVAKSANAINAFGSGIPAMLTIIDDDGRSEFYSDVYPIVQDLNVPLATAVIASRPGTADRFMTWAQISEMHCNGVEILNHTYSHYLSTDSAFENATEYDLATDYRKARQIFHEKGINNDLLVFSGSTGNYAKSQTAARWAGFCGAFLSSGNNNNTPETDKYSIKRYRIGEDYAWDYNTLKTLIDSTLQNGGWAVWMMHTSDSEHWTDSAKTVLRQVCQYALNSGLPIVSAEYGFKAYFGS